MMPKATLIIFASIFLWANLVFSAELKFSWLPNTEPDLAGYHIHYGPAEGNYTDQVECPKDNIIDGRVHCTVSGAPDDTAHFVATAYDTEGNRSDYSSEVVVNPAPAAPKDFDKIITVNIYVQ